jgi:hypothetical protein
LVNDFLLTYDVSGAVATVVQADLATTWDALMEVDLIEVDRKRPLVGVLGAIRVGVLLGDRPRDEIALGLGGRFWRPVIEFASVTVEQVRDFAEPGYSKTI